MPQIRSVSVGQKNFRVLFANDFAEGNLFHVRRPRSVSVDAAGNDRRDFFGRKINNVNLRLVFLRRRDIVIRAIHHVLAVGRPVGVNGTVLLRRSTSTLLPSAFITAILVRSFVIITNAIFFPSGDQAGSSWSASSRVSCAMFLPSASIVNSCSLPDSIEIKTSFWPSGEGDGSKFWA